MTRQKGWLAAAVVMAAGSMLFLNCITYQMHVIDKKNPADRVVYRTHTETALQEVAYEHYPQQQDKLVQAVKVFKQDKKVVAASYNQEMYIALAHECFKNREYTDAIRMCRKALQENHYLPHIWMLMGRSYVQLGAFTNAEEIFAEALKAFPELTELYRPELAGFYLDWGETSLADQDWDRAIQCYNRAIELLPDAGEVTEKMAETYCAIADELCLSLNYQRAEEFYAKAFRLIPDYKMAQLGLSEVYYYRGQQAQQYNQVPAAIQEYHKSLLFNQHNPKTREALAGLYFFLGELYYKNHDLKKSLEYYSQALEMEPEKNLKSRVKHQMEKVRADLKQAKFWANTATLIEDPSMLMSRSLKD